jgi:ssDNA-binding replication factor A large subunit
MAETKVLQKPKFIKVADLETARSGYNVYVKILTTEKKEIDTRDGGKITMVECTIGD